MPRRSPVPPADLARRLLPAVDRVTPTTPLRTAASGHIVAVKGLGGYQLACDATNADAVARLRAAKHRETKPFALMARDLDVIRRYCAVSAEEARLLASPAAPIVLLRATGDAVARRGRARA